ncbi:MAG: TolC family protein, partial [Acidobacteria bacterium]|nr:TolC family protein [Acidobacteriota bacterium]
MKLRYLVILLILSLNIYIPLFANLEEVLSLDQCTTLALKNNHLYESYRQEFRASQARVRQAGAFPQPEIAFDWDLQPKLFDFKHSAESYIGVNQQIEFPGRRYLRKKIAAQESALTGCEMDMVRLEIIFDVKKSFYQLLLNQEIQKYAAENLEMANDVLAKATEKYQSGDVSKLEVLRAKVEVARAKNQLEMSQNQVKLAGAQLNFLLARDPSLPLHIHGELRGPLQELSLPDLLVQAQNSRPELKKEQLAIKKESLAKKQGYLSFLPDFSLGLSRHRIKGEANTWAVALSFEVPLFFWQKMNGEIAEADANLAAAQERFKHLQHAVILDVENAFYNATSLRNQVEFFEIALFRLDLEVVQYGIGLLFLVDARVPERRVAGVPVAGGRAELRRPLLARDERHEGGKPGALKRRGGCERAVKFPGPLAHIGRHAGEGVRADGVEHRRVAGGEPPLQGHDAVAHHERVLAAGRAAFNVAKRRPSARVGTVEDTARALAAPEGR